MRDLETGAADALRRLALDEGLKARVAADPALRTAVGRVARRYIAGTTADEALPEIARIVAAGHRCTADAMGESCRDAALASAETEAFLELARRIGDAGLDCSISLDLSHVGSLIDPELCLRNTGRIAAAAAAIGQDVMISAEGSDRTGLVLDLYRQLCERHANVGITVQARLRRSGGDLDAILRRPGGRVRIVKGAYDEPESEALRREDPALADAFVALAERVAEAGRPLSVATHDEEFVDRLGGALASGGELEVLMGLDDGLLDRARAGGVATRTYVVFGEQWWLYVCNRLAEDPQRLLQALIDATAAGTSQTASISCLRGGPR